MDILVGLKAKLRFIERFYQTASHPFTEVKRKIEAGEEPFAPPPFDPETATDFEPPFLEESLNLVGQAALCLVQSSLREYLDGFISRSGCAAPTGRGNWFRRYKQFFLETYGVDWETGPVPAHELEEINLARNDIHHTGQEFGMTRRQSEEHQTRFPEGLFIDEMDRQVFRESSHTWPGRIYVTSDNLREAIRRVESFCEFLEEHRP
jgi:hypothetical protein